MSKRKHTEAKVTSEAEVVFNTVEAAEYVGLSPATLATRRSRGGSPTYTKLGRSVRYLRSDLDSYLRARRVRNTADEPLAEEN